jgi:hypothetical protein
LDAPFEPSEVAAVIRLKRSSSAPGEDQIQYSFWKEAAEDPLSLQQLTNLFNYIFSTASIPPDWYKAIISVMYKGKGPQDQPTNFRAISLTSTGLKIFESLIANRLSTWAEQKSIFSYHQAGFRKNHSTHDHIFALSAIQQASGSRNTYVAFVDLAKAFPSISRPLLLKKLASLGISSKVMNVIAALYEADSYQFLLSRSTLGTQVGTADKGTREGSCLSPLLFLLFVSDLPSFLAAARTLAPVFGLLRVQVLQFADDTALIAIGRKNLQRLLDRFAEYCVANGLRINGEKTEIINLRHGVRGSKDDVWDVAGSKVSITSHARYLGVLFGTGKKGTHHARNLRARNTAKVCALVGRIRRGGLTDTAFLLRIFRALIGTSATYGAGLLLPFPTHLLTKNLNPLLTTYLRSIWSLPRGTPNHFLLTIANLPCVKCECYMDAICFLLRKLQRWGANSRLVEAILTEMFSDSMGTTWLGHMRDYMTDQLKLSFTASTFEEFRSSLLLVDKASFRFHVTQRCHETCYPPSASKSHYYQIINLQSASSWICFSSSSAHYRLSRIFSSNSFRYRRVFSQLETPGECAECHVPVSVEHWFCCPARANDRAQFTHGTLVSLDGPNVLPHIFCDEKLLVAFEYVLSRFLDTAD